MKIIVMTKHDRRAGDEVRVFKYSEENVAKVKKEMETTSNNCFNLTQRAG